MKVLVTGGAGFIGSFITDELVNRGHEVTIYDNLEPQVHFGRIPSYLNKHCKFIKEDVRSEEALRQALKDTDVVFHKAAMVGVGQSMYQVNRYMGSNVMGTANLLDNLINTNHNVKKIIVASSMSCYGEGSYKCEEDSEVYPALRKKAQMEKNDWEMQCPICNKTLSPVPTKETKPLEPNSIYAISKQNQEQMVLNVGKTYGIPAVALRYFNVYGPRQSLSNPYTGVAAIFMSRIKNCNQPIVFEDGMQSRDFVSVHDIVQANMLAMESKSADYEVFNVGTGRHVTILEVAQEMARQLGSSVTSKVTGQFRPGDVRHCFADIGKIRGKLGYKPKITFEEGMAELVRWSAGQEAIDKVDEATKELRQKGLLSKNVEK